MARSPIPVLNREYPEHEHREFPKQIGLDAAGEQIVVHSDDEAESRADEVVYPKLLGYDKNGKPVVSQHPSQDDWKKQAVVAVKPEVDPAVLQRQKEEAETAERDAAELVRKAEAYEALKADQEALAARQKEASEAAERKAAEQDRLIAELQDAVKKADAEKAAAAKAAADKAAAETGA